MYMCQYDDETEIYANHTIKTSIMKMFSSNKLDLF